MSVRQGLLALLAERPMYGYQLRQEFESRTGATWPLNVGQVYTTLQRLERDGLVEPLVADGGDGAEHDGTAVYRLTAAGRSEVDRWWTTPVGRGAPSRDELAIKLALAVTVPGVQVPLVVQRQRTETLRGLQEYTRLKHRADADHDLAWLLVLDSLVFAAEAEVRWLDHVEARVARAAQRRPAAQPARAAALAPEPTPAAASVQRPGVAR